MSLKIWLPMNRDLRNQGLLNNTITNSGATYSSDGKLGGCYVFDGVNDSLTVGNLSTMVDTDFSFACWFYKDEWGTKGYETIFGGSSGFELESKVSSTNSPVLKLYNWGGGSCTYELSKWNHVVFTRNTAETKLYLNGELKATGTAGTIPNHDYFVGSWNTTTQQNFKGKMCDVRIYDHCLSPMEVKELAKGLVLHYPLNRQGWGQENLLLNSANIKVDKLNNALDSRTEYWAANFGQSYSNFTGGEQVVLSFDCEMIIRTTPVYFLVYNTNNKGPIQFPNTNAAPQINSLNPSVGDIVKLRIKLPVTMIKRDSPSTTNNFIEFYTNYGSNNFYKITNLKLEMGSVATPWCPNSSDALATTMGLNSTTEYDCSGFCNNLNKNGTYSYTSDTPKYAVSTKFNGTEWINGTTPGAEIMTLACWAKTSKNKSTSQFMVADSTSNLCISFYSGCIIGVFGSTRSTGSKSTLGSSYKENDWNHFVVVKSGTSGERTIYCNGELLTPTSNDYWSVASGFFIGTRNTSAALPFYGQICDVRAYATALSADDVKSLYQNCATIDPDGTIRGQIRS